MPWHLKLNPRLHLAAAIGWAVLALVSLAGLMAANLAASQAEQRVRVDAEGLLAEYATQVRDAVSMSLVSRRGLLRATAVQVATVAASDPRALPSALQSAQSQFPEFTWLGAVDAEGLVLAHAGPALADPRVAALPWFQQGRLAPFVSDQHAPALSSASGGSDGQRLIDLAVPLPGGGVLAGFLSWEWLETQITRMQLALNRSRQLELMLAARDGTVLIGPPGWIGRKLSVDLDASEAGAYVVGARAQLRLASDLGLGWTAIVRQRTDLALAPARSTSRTVFLTVFAAGVLAALSAALAASLLMRRLTRLAVDAEAVRGGTRRALAAPEGRDEIGRIGGALAELVDHLQAEKQALQELNAELDQRVTERTLRIERLAGEARQTAVTRERLRIARDLHDTLAHSLMALLTQVRLVRKLQHRLDPQALDDELGRAEAAAATGLAESRLAIAQMRDNGIRDGGLGAALRELVRRFGERTGLVVHLSAQDDAASASDDRAETAFRIVEEALRNIERHAAAQSVWIDLTCDEARRIRLEVADDGVGFDTTLAKPGHYGLRGMQEQAALIGAQLDVSSAPGSGTRITLGLGL